MIEISKIIIIPSRFGREIQRKKKKKIKVEEDVQKIRKETKGEEKKGESS